jgi:hypothetical protein
MQPGRIALLAAVLCGLSTVPAHAATGSKDVLPDMVLHHLAHEAVDGAADRCDELKDIGTTYFLIERPLDRLHLAPNAASLLQQLVLFANCVTHDVPKGRQGTPLYFDPHLLM